METIVKANEAYVKAVFVHAEADQARSEAWAVYRDARNSEAWKVYRDARNEADEALKVRDEAKKARDKAEKAYYEARDKAGQRGISLV